MWCCEKSNALHTKTHTAFAMKKCVLMRFKYSGYNLFLAYISFPAEYLFIQIINSQPLILVDLDLTLWDKWPILHDLQFFPTKSFIQTFTDY